MSKHITERIDLIKQKYPNTEILLLGDFNHMKDRYLKNATQLHQIVKNPTHDSSVIDLCYTSLNNIYTKIIHLPGIGLSKHQCILFEPSYHCPKKETIYITKRNQSCRNKQNLLSAVSNLSWVPLFKMTSCEEKFNFFTNVINDVIDEYLPVHTVKRNSNDYPWVTDKFRYLIKQRQHHFNNGNIKLFNIYRNKVNRERKHLKKQYVDNTLQNLKTYNPKDWWKQIKTISGMRECSDGLTSLAQSETGGDSLMLANNINEIFVNVSSHIVPLQTHTSTTNAHVEDRYIISVKDVEKQLTKLNTNKALGPDEIPNWILKDLSGSLSEPICSIWNASFREAYVPTMWKSANICAIPKVTPPLNPEKDLRPISLTPILCKGIEYHARNWLMDFFKPSLDENQYGSQKECSTTLALAHLIHNWLIALEKGSTAIRILLLDFRKAFDLVDHNILLDKISSTGAPDFLCKWLHSFLCERKQRVKIGNCYSKWETINGGVPQGTLLGPVTFLIHINDLSTSCESIKYVDDTTIWEACSLSNSTSKIQLAANQVSSWCMNNNMKINVDKTKEMIIYFGKKNMCFPYIKMNDNELERVESTKLLGLIINNKLTWSDHVDYICKKASKRLYFLRLLKRANISPADIISVYNSIIRSVLEYACEIWHPSLTQAQARQLEHIQKRAIKIANSNIDYADALCLYNIDTLYKRREDRCKNFFNDMCKSGHRLNSLLPPINKVNHLRSRKRFQLPRVKTERLKKSPVYYGVFRFQES
jgi:hypothetical protein